MVADSLRREASADKREVDWRRLASQVRAEIVSLVCPKNPHELDAEQRAYGTPAFGSDLWKLRSRRGLVEIVLNLDANAHETIHLKLRRVGSKSQEQTFPAGTP